MRSPREVAWTWSNPPPASDVSIFSRFEPYIIHSVGKLEPYFADLGEKVTDSAIQMQATWKRMALGQGPSERAFAVVLGYAVVGMLLSLYLNILTVGNVRSAGRAVRSVIRQQLLVVKVRLLTLLSLCCP